MSLLIILPIVCKSFQINVNGMRANVFDQVLGQLFWPRHDYFPSLVSTVYVFLTQIQNRPNTKLVAPFQQIMYYKIKQGDAQTVQSMLAKIKIDQTKLNGQ